MKSSRTRKALGRPKGTSIHKGYGEGKTSADVAQELEDNYGLVETFWNQIEDKVAERLEDALSEQFEEIVKMDQVPKKLIPDAFAEQIIDDFKGFLDHEEHGIKTTAARRGVSHLLPRPYARSNPPRPSFIDTGLYRASFRAWTEED